MQGALKKLWRRGIPSRDGNTIVQNVIAENSAVKKMLGEYLE